jgi:integrase
VLGKTIGNVNALRAKRPIQERHAPSVAETQSLLATMGNEGGYPTNLIAKLLYDCGLRISEPLNPRTKDLDLQRRCLFGNDNPLYRSAASP